MSRRSHRNGSRCARRDIMESIAGTQCAIPPLVFGTQRSTYAYPFASGVTLPHA